MLNSFDWRSRQEIERRRRVDEALEGPYGDSASLYDSTSRLLRDANFPLSLEFARQFILKFHDRCKGLGISPAHDAILLNMMQVAGGVYACEGISPDVVSEKTLPDPTGYGSGMAAGFLRDLLLRQQRKAVDPSATLTAITNTLLESCIALTRRLPPLALDACVVEGVPTIALVDLLPDTGFAVEEVLSPFMELNEIGLFQILREHINRKLATITDRSRSKKSVPPSEYDGTPQEIVDAYLGGTVLRYLFEARLPFDISLEDRGEHTAIVAGSGWGKTQLLQSIVADDLERDDPPALVVIDSTGAMVQRIQRLEIFSEHLKDRLLIIDPEMDPVPALNPFDVSNPRLSAYDVGLRERLQGEIIDLFNYVFSTIKNPLTSRMETAFAFMVRLLISIPGANIHTLLELLDDAPPKGDFQQAKFKLPIENLDQTTQQFFKSQYYTGHSDALREQIRARVFDILRIPAFERMFAGANKVDFFAELNRGSIIVVNTSESQLKDASTTFGRYIVARVMAAAFERAPIPPDKRRQAFLIVDEAAPYFDETFEKLLNRVRQFKLGVVIAFQNLEQASEKLRSTIASSTAIKYAGGTGYTDARWLAREMRIEPDFILAQRRDSRRPPKWTQFACHVRNVTDRALSLTVPFYILENMPRMSDAAHKELLERNRERVAAQPTDAPSAPEQKPKAQQIENPVELLAGAYKALALAMQQGDQPAIEGLKEAISVLQQQLSPVQQPDGAAAQPAEEAESRQLSEPAVGAPPEVQTAGAAAEPRKNDTVRTEGSAEWS